MVTENKTKTNPQLGLNGPDKAQTLTTTVRLKSIGKENMTSYWCVKTTQVATKVDLLTLER